MSVKKRYLLRIIKYATDTIVEIVFQGMISPALLTATIRVSASTTRQLAFRDSTFFKISNLPGVVLLPVLGPGIKELDIGPITDCGCSDAHLASRDCSISLIPSLSSVDNLVGSH
jgi:hypothetical protein